MGVTLRDVAERAGVSPSAVSRTYTQGASVSDKTRAKVQKAAQELGYRPSALASALTTGRTKLIGLIADNFHNPVFLEVFDGFTRGLQARGLRPLLINLSGETDPAQSLDLLTQYSVDGVIVASSTLSPDFARAFRDAGVPVVHCFGRWSRHPEVHVVTIDNVACGRLAAETLHGRGYRRVGFIGGPETSTSTEDRHKGFMDAWHRLQGETPKVGFARSYTYEAGADAMAHHLARGPAEAYFCADDVLSCGALTAARKAGLRVPEDLGIIGLNDMEMAGWDSFALTTIRQPVVEIIDGCIAQVVALLDDPTLAPEVQVHPCEVVERDTLRPRS